MPVSHKEQVEQQRRTAGALADKLDHAVEQVDIGDNTRLKLLISDTIGLLRGIEYASPVNQPRLRDNCFAIAGEIGELPDEAQRELTERLCITLRVGGQEGLTAEPQPSSDSRSRIR